MKPDAAHALQSFMEVFTFMSGMASAPRQDWMGPREQDFARARTAWAKVEVAWASPLDSLSELKDHVDVCIREYEAGHTDAGDWAFREVERARQALVEKYLARR